MCGECAVNGFPRRRGFANRYAFTRVIQPVTLRVRAGMGIYTAYFGLDQEIA